MGGYKHHLCIDPSNVVTCDREMLEKQDILHLIV